MRHLGVSSFTDQKRGPSWYLDSPKFLYLKISSIEKNLRTDKHIVIWSVMSSRNLLKSLTLKNGA